MAAKDIKIPVPWGHIAGKEWGSSSGEPWIALHGWLDNCGSFDTLIPHFPEDKHRIIAIGNYEPNFNFNFQLDEIFFADFKIPNFTYEKKP